MESPNSKKFKKRRTRKCLDELRKRRQINDDNKVQKNKSCCLRSCIGLTSSRISLCNKAVRSETVTRLQVSRSTSTNCNELKENKEIVHDKYQLNNVAFRRNDCNEYIFNKEQAKTYISDSNSEIEDTMNYHNIYKESKNQTPVSAISFSRGSFDENVIDSDLEETHKKSLIGSYAISSNNNEDSFSCVDGYPERTAPRSLLFLDVITESEESDMGMESFANTEGSGSFLEHNTSSISNDIMSEPTEQDFPNSLENPDPVMKSNKLEVSVWCPTINNILQVSDIQSSSTFASDLYDSPEYNYYPHKLN